jgi:imidazoleglycerol-phosphate dehydratase
MGRSAKVERKTTETQVIVEIEVDGQGKYEIETSIPFLDHMLSLLAKHGLFDLKVKALGDTQIDFHHTVEDVGISLGQALFRALGEKKGLRRYGNGRIPMEGALATVSVDIGGRPFLVYNTPSMPSKVGDFDVELVPEFIRALANNLGANIHVNVKYGDNAHHMIEAVFKALAKALDQATGIDPRVKDVPSTKGRI